MEKGLVCNIDEIMSLVWGMGKVSRRRKIV